MGYTTKFSGAIKLSRPLTMAEAKQILEFNDDPDTIPLPHPNSYMQWVPGQTLDSIGWDGGEKFYEYEAWLQWLVNWLKERGIEAVGTIYWSGEESTDTGILNVIYGVVTAQSGGHKPAGFKPMTLRALADLALEQATKVMA